MSSTILIKRENEVTPVHFVKNIEVRLLNKLRDRESKVFRTNWMRWMVCR